MAQRAYERRLRHQAPTQTGEATTAERATPTRSDPLPIAPRPAGPHFASGVSRPSDRTLVARNRPRLGAGRRAGGLARGPGRGSVGARGHRRLTRALASLVGPASGMSRLDRRRVEKGWVR